MSPSLMPAATLRCSTTGIASCRWLPGLPRRREAAAGLGTCGLAPTHIALSAAVRKALRPGCLLGQRGSRECSLSEPSRGVRLWAKQSARKKPPERRCPRGAEDTKLFRERLDARRAGDLGLRPSRGVEQVCPKRATSLRAVARRFAVRRQRRSIVTDTAQCRPIHVD